MLGNVENNRNNIVVLKQITVRIPEEHYRVLRKAMRDYGYAQLSELLRHIIREWVVRNYGHGLRKPKE